MRERELAKGKKVKEKQTKIKERERDRNKQEQVAREGRRADVFVDLRRGLAMLYLCISDLF